MRRRPPPRPDARTAGPAPAARATTISAPHVRGLFPLEPFA